MNITINNKTFHHQEYHVHNRFQCLLLERVNMCEAVISFNVEENSKWLITKKLILCFSTSISFNPIPIWILACYTLSLEGEDSLKDMSEICLFKREYDGYSVEQFNKVYSDLNFRDVLNYEKNWNHFILMRLLIFV